MSCCLPADYYLLMGTNTHIIKSYAQRLGIAKEKLLDLAEAGKEKVLESIWALTTQRSLVFAVGNIAGIGLELSRYFQGEETVNA